MRDVTVQVAGNIGDAAVAAKNEPRQHLEQQLESFGEANTSCSLSFHILYKTVHSTHQNVHPCLIMIRHLARHLLWFNVTMRI